MGIFNDNSQNNNTGGSGQPGLPGQKGDPGIGFKLTADGNFDLDNKQIKNLSGGTDKSGAVNYGQLLEHTENNENSYHLQQSFSFFKNFRDQAAVPQSSQIKFPSNHHHHGLYYISKEGSNNGFGGQAWVSLKMTNTLSAGFYTVIFETFAGLKDGSNVTYLNNETLLQQVHGDSHISILNFNHDYQTTHSKAIIKFTTDGQSAEINFEIRYYGSSFNNSNLNMLFFSRVVKGSVGDNFNHDIFNINDIQLQNQTLYFEDINMNGNQIQNIAAPIIDNDAANKKYVDSKNSIQDIEINNKANVDGSNISSDFTLKNNKIIELNTQDDVPISDYPNYIKDSKTAINKSYANSHFLKKDINQNDFDLNQKVIKNAEPYNDSNYDNTSLVPKEYVDREFSKSLWTDGLNSMNADLDMSDHNVVFINTPSIDVLKPSPGVISNNYQKDRQTAVHKEYVETNYFRKNNGNLDMKNHIIKNIKEFVEDDSSQAASDAQKYDVVNWGKIHEIRGDLKREINAVEYEALNRINPDPMEDDIDMGNNFITNIKDPLPSNSNYATTVNFVNKTVSDNNTTISTLIDSKINERDHLNIKAAKQENVFSFVMIDDLFKEDDSDITKVGKVNKDFYDIHKETYQFNISYDGNIGYYSTRTGIDLKSIDLGEYTLVFEMYFDGSKIDKNEVIVNAVSTPLNISRNRTNKFADHSRTVINFHKYGNIGIIDLDIDITMKNKGGISYDPTTTIYVIVYGVSGHQNDVDSGVWDRVYYIENNAVKFEATIDMDNHNIGMKNGQIKGLGDGVENSDAINVKQLNEMESNLENYMKTEIDKVKTDDTNNHALLLALYNYIMKNGTKVSILKDLYFTDSQETKTSNTYLFNFNNHLDSSNRNNFTFYYVFKHNTTSGTGNEASIAMQWKKSNLFIHLFIHLTLNRIIISISPLVSPSFISSINIPKEALEKQIWFWIWMQGTTFYLITSGNNTFTHNLRNIGLGADYQFVKFNVDDSPFPKIRGLITSNVYDYNSEAYVKAREFERAQGTII